ncbi:hypothetical protein ACFL5Z_18565 [Planctomycetota bacterium]
MATKEQLDSITDSLNSVPEITKNCHDIVLALIEIDQRISYGKLWARIAPTEYDRAREQIISTCRSTIRELINIRSTLLSPEAIKATSYLYHVVNCCKKCPAQNKKNTAAGKSFSCLLKESFKENSPREFHFKLNKKGQIVAQR